MRAAYCLVPARGRKLQSLRRVERGQSPPLYYPQRPSMVYGTFFLAMFLGVQVQSPDLRNPGTPTRHSSPTTNIPVSVQKESHARYM